MSNTFVVGGGWSAGQAPLDELWQYGHVIGVNESMVLVARVHTGLTMDRLWFENRWDKVAERGVPEVFVRRKCDCNVPGHYAKTFEHVNTPYPSTKPGVLHGENSGACAMNLAMQRMFEGDNLFLLGFDMCRGPGGEPYWHPPYEWRPTGATTSGSYKKWARDMEGFSHYASAQGLNVYNVSPRSQIQCIKKLTADQMMEMIG
jgi:hypothetical protein